MLKAEPYFPFLNVLRPSMEIMGYFVTNETLPIQNIQTYGSSVSFSQETT